MSANPVDIYTLRTQAAQPRESNLPMIAPGFGSLQSFELMQRAAKLLSSSTLVPVAYRSFDEKKGIENPNALANCVVALNMAQRMGADPLMVMQNLYIVEGRPSWSSQWVIAAVNGCGRFSPLRYELTDLGEKEVSYSVTKWVNRERVVEEHKAKIRNLQCVAWCIEKGTNERLTSPAVNMEMAVKEGWYGKSGSKWQTMPELMLRYRTASFFGRLYAPELLMGLQTVEEAHDIIDMNPDGTIASVTTAELRSDMRCVNPEDAVAQSATRRAAGAPGNVSDATLRTDLETGEITGTTPETVAQRSTAPTPEEQAAILAEERAQAAPARRTRAASVPME